MLAIEPNPDGVSQKLAGHLMGPVPDISGLGFHQPEIVSELAHDGFDPFAHALHPRQPPAEPKLLRVLADRCLQVDTQCRAIAAWNCGLISSLSPRTIPWLACSTS